MTIAGVPVSAGAIASLARRLEDSGQGESAQRIEYALDAGQEELALAPSEGRVILDVLEDCPDDLVALRDELRRTHGAGG
jgi:hypothetical protein